MPEIREVALVGGGPSEPELEILNFAIGITVSFFGIEQIPGQNFTPLNLNNNQDIHQGFDLVICSQVLEHVWNHEVAFDNLAKLVKPGGLLWVSCPTSNQVGCFGLAVPLQTMPTVLPNTIPQDSHPNT